jgi:hypothetical protein
MALVRRGSAWALVESLDAHPAHQCGHMLAPDSHPVQLQYIPQHPAARKGILQMQFVDLAHQRQVGRRNWLRDVIHRGAR